nr:NERD domain-containing protein [uncultured Desulfobacter sp.]
MFNSFFIYLIILTVLVTIARTPVFKGFIGELIVNVLSTLMLDKKAYTLIRNVTLPTDDGSTQIDHVIISKYGIFVVETKNMKGWIFGGERQATWTQVIFKTKTKFQNPLRQNYKHVKTLEGLLGLPADCFHSVIVFMGNCKFKTPMPANVVFPLEYIGYVKSKLIHRLEDEQVEQVVQAIELGRFDRSLKTHVDHARHVKKVVAEKQQANRCPKCGSPLVVRIVKKGPNAGSQFLGCSGFPRCRYTTPVDNI